MTDQNLASLPPIELIGILNIAQANYLNAKSDSERAIIQKQKYEILDAMRTIQDALQRQIELFS